MELLPPSGANNLWSAADILRSTGPSSAANLASAVWPETLERLMFKSDMAVSTVSRPSCLQQVSFGDDFNQPIADVVWPVSLKKLSFGPNFNQLIVKSRLAGLPAEALVGR
ncbi:unnamed protein product [Ectocarpus sp. 12 AP-2014]